MAVASCRQVASVGSSARQARRRSRASRHQVSVKRLNSTRLTANHTTPAAIAIMPNHRICGCHVGSATGADCAADSIGGATGAGNWIGVAAKSGASSACGGNSSTSVGNSRAGISNAAGAAAISTTGGVSTIGASTGCSASCSEYAAGIENDQPVTPAQASPHVTSGQTSAATSVVR